MQIFFYSLLQRHVHIENNFKMISVYNFQIEELINYLFWIFSCDFKKEVSSLNYIKLLENSNLIIKLFELRINDSFL